VVGHSYGGAIALQLALDAPGAVHSLALLEPCILTE
jgi:pimeloyl-ACP methyl ester carboxylesterase